MTLRLIFTRHSESEANIQQVISNRDLPHHLTAKGRTQAETLAEQLAIRPILAIYTSPIVRAQETAQIVAERVGLPFQISDALREFDCGEMEGRGDEAAWQAHNAVIKAWNEDHDQTQRIPGGESFQDMRARFVPFVQQTIAQYAAADGDVVLIGHGSLLIHMLPLVLTNIDRTFVQQHSMANCVCIVARVEQGQLLCEAWDTHQVLI